jgi:hypothetical protein
MRWKSRLPVFIVWIFFISLSWGCATPKIQTVDPQFLLNSELQFIKDGVTTREEVSLALGVPSGQLEGDRILMYQFRADDTGKWHLICQPFFGGSMVWVGGAAPEA